MMKIIKEVKSGSCMNSKDQISQMWTKKQHLDKNVYLYFLILHGLIIYFYVL